MIWHDEIQDEISKLRNEIHNKDTETIQAIIKASTPVTPVEDANVLIMKAILPELLKNPSSMNALLELGEVANRGENNFLLNERVCLKCHYNI